jgi:hypothetical protein
VSLPTAFGIPGGPKIFLATGDAFANRFVEQEFFAWADAVGLAENLHRNC